MAYQSSEWYKLYLVLSLRWNWCALKLYSVKINIIKYYYIPHALIIVVIKMVKLLSDKSTSSRETPMNDFAIVLYKLCPGYVSDIKDMSKRQQCKGYHLITRAHTPRLSKYQNSLPFDEKAIKMWNGAHYALWMCVLKYFSTTLLFLKYRRKALLIRYNPRFVSIIWISLYKM